MASYLATATVGQFNLKSYTARGRDPHRDAIDPVLYRKPAPRTGSRFAISGGDDSAYKRLTRTIAVPAGGGRLKFAVTRDTEGEWLGLLLRRGAPRVGSDAWTTLPDLNGHSSHEDWTSCPYWLEDPSVPGRTTSPRTTEGKAVDPSGTTGAWNAASGRQRRLRELVRRPGGVRRQQSGDRLRGDQRRHRGQRGVRRRRRGTKGQGRPRSRRSRAFDGWTVSGPPAGSPGNATDWRVATEAQAGRPETTGRRLVPGAGEPPLPVGGSRAVPVQRSRRDRRDDPDLGFAWRTRPGRSTPRLGSPPRRRHVGRGHELAHQWTGDSLSLTAGGDLAQRGVRDLHRVAVVAAPGPGDRPRDLRLLGPDTGRRLSLDHRSATRTRPHLDRAVYDRGAITFHALRLQIGDPASSDS